MINIANPLKDIDNISYVVNPYTGKHVPLSPDEQDAKRSYLVSWKARLEFLRTSAVYTDSRDPDLHVSYTGKLCPHYPSPVTYVPHYPARYTEYLAQIRQLTA